VDVTRFSAIEILRWPSAQNVLEDIFVGTLDQSRLHSNFKLALLNYVEALGWLPLLTNVLIALVG